MHKITKGLKKKKKGKKSKHKEEELFKPEELEAYRREHQEEAAALAPEKNEEWKKFLALTSGVDDVLKKTQGDLDRIKSTSFFQRKPPPSELKREEVQSAQSKELQKPDEKQEQVEEQKVDLGIVAVSDSESEEEEDDIFDTTYIDAIAAGEVKLAYIPESPIQETAGDDPFDTSIAERAILGPAVERKGKKLVSIGPAVEVLTGRVQIPTCAKATSARRQILKETNLLLGSFDDNANSISTNSATTQVEATSKTLLDDDAPTPLAEVPIDLSLTLHRIEPQINTFQNDTINKFPSIIEDEDDEEFAVLAAESLTKSSVGPKTALVTTSTKPQEENWTAFATQSAELEVVEEDPFDTSFAENILPGKAELKLIENEILAQDNNSSINARVENKLTQIINKVSINVTDPTGQRESITSLDRVSEAELNFIKPIHRDLLGGSNTDLSNLNDQPLRPSDKIDDDYIEYSDPFDTSIVETTTLPGQTELKFLEKELLGDLSGNLDDFIDSDFNPREESTKERTLSRPDVLNISTKTVSFDLPSPQNHFFDNSDEQSKVFKPLTPFYVRKNSVPDSFFDDDIDLVDPFDTSFVSDIRPGKLELKLIESELFDPATDRRLSISDQDFDPRDEKKVKIEKIKEIVNKLPATEKSVKSEPLDLLSSREVVSAKVLTPSAQQQTFENISYCDPFDTSIAVNIVPGKTELKLLETELINQQQDLVDQDFDPRASNKTTKKLDFLDSPSDITVQQPLNPIVCEQNTFDIVEDIDPFDTSIASNIAPGKAELKLLESQLI